MVSQKMVMLLHYPPYSAMQKSDYLDNATLEDGAGFWKPSVFRRKIGRYSPPSSTYSQSLPRAAVKAIAFPPTSAKKYFGDRDRVTSRQCSMRWCPDNSEYAQPVPVIVFGEEAREYWKDNYSDASTSDV